MAKEKNKDNEQIINEIIEGFNKVHNNAKATIRGEWTNAFMQCLVDLGVKHNKYKVYTSAANVPKGKGGGEWLFDLCWSIEGDGDKWKENFKGLKLICESEWNTWEDEIVHDFQKLAVAKADIKIMLVQYKSNNEFEDIKKWCERSVVEDLHNDNSEYYLIGSGNDDSKKVKCCRLWN